MCALLKYISDVLTLPGNRRKKTTLPIFAPLMENSLNRFLEAREINYDIALAEIHSGHKRGHWIWYVFPQYKALGASFKSRHYGISDFEEATAFLAHPVLGPRLIEISNALLNLKSCDPGDVMGYPDDLKLKSSMTLFAAVPGADEAFENVLKKFFYGTRDARTLQLLKRD